MDHEHCQMICQGYNGDVDVDCVSKHSLDTENDGENSSSATSSLESEQVPSCWICFEAFQVGEMVSWSSTSDCDHVFHPSCIEAWLLRHVDCPCCRRRYLLVDYTREKIPKSKLQALVKERKKRRQTTYFCIQDGLVTIDSLVKSEGQQSMAQNEGSLPENDANDCTDLCVETQGEALTESLNSDDDTNSDSIQNKVMLPFRSVDLSADDQESGFLSIANGMDENVNKDECDDHRVILSKGSTETTSTAASSTKSQV